MPRPVCHPDVGSRHWGNLQRMQVGDIGAARFWKRNVAFLLMNETNLPCVRISMGHTHVHNATCLLLCGWLCGPRIQIYGF